MKGKTKIRLFSLLMSLVIACTGLQAVAFAEEVTDEGSNNKIISIEELEDGRMRTTYEMELTPDSVDENGIATIAAVNSSFTMTGNYYRGADRKYSGNRISYQMTVTSSNGTAVDKKVSIQLWDYNHTYYLVEHIINADGITVKEPKVSITPNRYYYFKYYLAYGSSSNLKITMVIDTWTE